MARFNFNLRKLKLLAKKECCYESFNKNNLRLIITTPNDD